MKIEPFFWKFSKLENASYFCFYLNKQKCNILSPPFSCVLFSFLSSLPSFLHCCFFSPIFSLLFCLLSSPFSLPLSSVLSSLRDKIHTHLYYSVFPIMRDSKWSSGIARVKIHKAWFVVCVCKSECKLQLLLVLWNIFRIRKKYFRLTPNSAADSTQYYNSLKMGWNNQSVCFQTLTTKMHTQKRKITTTCRMHSLVPCYPLSSLVGSLLFLYDSKTFSNFPKLSEIIWNV